MPDFITLIENLSKIDCYHTSSIGNINTAQSLAMPAKIFFSRSCVLMILLCILYSVGKVVHPKYYKHLKKGAHQNHLEFGQTKNGLISGRLACTTSSKTEI